MAKIALDVHCHLIPASHLSSMPGITWNETSGSLAFDGRTINLRPLFEPMTLIAWMDENEVEQAWISVPPLVYRQSLDELASADWSNRLNQGLRRIAEQHPWRLFPLYHLPVEHPQLAAKIAQNLGAKRYALCAGGETELTLSDVRLDALWKVLDAASAFVFLHPGRCCDRRLGAFYLENLVGNPHETAVAAAHLVFGDVLQRFSNIAFCLAHGGGTVPMMAGRWQRGYDAKQPGIDTHRERPLALLSRLYVDCITHDVAALICSAEIFGTDRILFGSDWPFLMGLSAPQDYIAQLPPTLQDQIRYFRSP